MSDGRTTEEECCEWRPNSPAQDPSPVEVNSLTCQILWMAYVFFLPRSSIREGQACVSAMVRTCDCTHNVTTAVLARRKPVTGGNFTLEMSMATSSTNLCNGALALK